MTVTLSSIMATSRRWVFTLNNPTQDEKTFLNTKFEDRNIFKYAVYGNEIGQNGTPHLQGFFVLSSPKRLAGVRTLLSDRAHFEAAVASSEQAADYCKKDGDFIEFGTLPNERGRRRDLEEFYEWGDSFTVTNGRPPGSPEIAKQFPSQYLRYPRAVALFAHRADPVVLREGEPSPWQTALAAELDGEADDRSVIFYVDPEGGKGKTWFQQWYLSLHHKKTQVLSIGKRDDLAYAINETKSVFLFNIPRDGMQFVQYTIFEQLKDKMVFSNKYQSRLKLLRSAVHVVVFCNELPDMTKMSEDRYVIRNL